MEPKKSFFRRAEDAGPRPERAERAERAERPERAERAERSEYSQRPRPTRPEGQYKSPRTGGKPAFGKPKFGKPATAPREPQERVPENVIFGVHPVREAIEAGTEIEKLYFRRPGGEHTATERTDRATSTALNALKDQAAEAGIHLQEVPLEKLNRLSRNGNHQGVVAVVAAIKYKEQNELLEELAAKIAAGGSPLVVLLDSVTDVRNFGAIARSAECAGADALIISAKNAAPVNAEAIKSSAGALTLLPVCRAGSLKLLIGRLRDIGFQCVAGTEKSQQLFYEVDLRGPTAIVVGSEERGVSRDILSLCDAAAAIPLAGRIESLNVSAAAAILLFETIRQRQ